MKKYVLLIWNKFNFLFFIFLSALIVILSGTIIANNIKKTPEISKPSASYDRVISQQKTKPYLGHFPYAENEQQNLVKVADFYGREEFLDRVVAEAFNKMKLDANASGVDLTLISGFRPIAEQKKLFLKQISKRGSKEEAARLSAPPGYSEHHTGYALDIGEGENIDTFLKLDFEYTKAYRWLINNAHKYGFELSFPKNNLQGVSYEPWHWRFVRTPEAQKIFALTNKSEKLE